MFKKNIFIIIIIFIFSDLNGSTRELHPAFKSGLFPGWGEVSLSKPKQSRFFILLELTLWSSCIGLYQFSNHKKMQYQSYAAEYAGVNPENKFYIERNQTLNKTTPSIPLEIKFKEEIKPRYNYQIKNPSETDNLVNTFENGSIAMVKRGKNNASSTEFFFVTNKIPELDGRYSIFGKIIKGLDILEKIKKEDFIKEVKISN